MKRRKTNPRRMRLLMTTSQFPPTSLVCSCYWLIFKLCSHHIDWTASTWPRVLVCNPSHLPKKQRLGYDVCVEVKKEDYQNCFVLCCARWYWYAHTRAVLNKITVECLLSFRFPLHFLTYILQSLNWLHVKPCLCAVEFSAEKLSTLTASVQFHSFMSWPFASVQFS